MYVINIWAPNVLIIGIIANYIIRGLNIHYCIYLHFFKHGK